MIIVNNRDKIEWNEGMTVTDLLKKMNYDYSLISVHINDRYVPDQEYGTIKVPDNASVAVIHLAHGG